jgi:four helix bundle protein
VKSFEELDCWKKAYELRKKLSELVKKFPSDEKYRLTDQVIRSSRSVTANIAEGFGRFHYQEYAQYCRQSRGSLFELVDHLIVARDEKYISEAEYLSLKAEIEGCLIVLNGFINYLLKAKAQSASKIEEPELSYELNSPLTINN